MDWQSQKKIGLRNHNYSETISELRQKNRKLLNLSEFKEFLKEAKKSDSKLYHEITKRNINSRSEWINARFEHLGNFWFVEYCEYDELGELKSKKEALDTNTLIENNSFGVSLESWLDEPTNQGLPKIDAPEGDLIYWGPRNGSVAWFVADSSKIGLHVGGFPSVKNPNLGSRFAEKL